MTSGPTAFGLGRDENVDYGEQAENEFDQQLKRVMTRMAELGHPVHISSRRRNAAQQAEQWAKNRDVYGNIIDKKKPVATNADGVNTLSNHQLGVAADLWFDGKAKPSDKLWSLLGKVAKDEGLVWGGDWPRLQDKVHVETGVPKLKLGETPDKWQLQANPLNLAGGPESVPVLTRARGAQRKAEATPVAATPPAVTAAADPHVTAKGGEITQLTPQQEVAFQDWVKESGITDADHPQSFYDYRGLWKQMGGMVIPPEERGKHQTDKFKQHGHPTFSEESIYSKGPGDGGTWAGEGDNAVFVPAGKTAPPPPASALPAATSPGMSASDWIASLGSGLADLLPSFSSSAAAPPAPPVAAAPPVEVAPGAPPKSKAAAVRQTQPDWQAALDVDPVASTMARAQLLLGAHQPFDPEADPVASTMQRAGTLLAQHKVLPPQTQTSEWQRAGQLPALTVPSAPVPLTPGQQASPSVLSPGMDSLLNNPAAAQEHPVASMILNALMPSAQPTKDIMATVPERLAGLHPASELPGYYGDIGERMANTVITTPFHIAHGAGHEMAQDLGLVNRDTGAWQNPLTAPPRTKEQDLAAIMDPSGLGRTMVWNPMKHEQAQMEEAGRQGDVGGVLGHEAAALVPVIGPMASDILQRMFSPDLKVRASAFGDLAAFPIMEKVYPAITEDLGNLPSRLKEGLKSPKKAGALMATATGVPKDPNILTSFNVAAHEVQRIAKETGVPVSDAKDGAFKQGGEYLQRSMDEHRAVFDKMLKASDDAGLTYDVTELGKIVRNAAESLRSLGLLEKAPALAQLDARVAAWEQHPGAAAQGRPQASLKSGGPVATTSGLGVRQPGRGMGRAPGATAAQTPKLGEVSATEMEDVLQQVNAALKQGEKMFGSERANRARRTDFGTLQAQAEHIRDTLYKGLDRLGAGTGKQAREIQVRWGQMREVMDALQKRQNAAVVERTVRPGRLKTAVQRIGRMAGEAVLGRSHGGVPGAVGAVVTAEGIRQGGIAESPNGLMLKALGQVREADIPGKPDWTPPVTRGLQPAFSNFGRSGAQPGRIVPSPPRGPGAPPRVNVSAATVSPTAGEAAAFHQPSFEAEAQARWDAQMAAARARVAAEREPVAAEARATQAETVRAIESQREAVTRRQLQEPERQIAGNVETPAPTRGTTKLGPERPPRTLAVEAETPSTLPAAVDWRYAGREGAPPELTPTPAAPSGQVALKGRAASEAYSRVRTTVEKGELSDLEKAFTRSTDYKHPKGASSFERKDTMAGPFVNWLRSEKALKVSEDPAYQALVKKARAVVEPKPLRAKAVTPKPAAKPETPTPTTPKPAAPKPTPKPPKKPQGPPEGTGAPPASAAPVPATKAVKKGRAASEAARTAKEAKSAEPEPTEDEVDAEIRTTKAEGKAAGLPEPTTTDQKNWEQSLGHYVGTHNGVDYYLGRGRAMGGHTFASEGKGGGVTGGPGIENWASSKPGKAGIKLPPELVEKSKAEGYRPPTKPPTKPGAAAAKRAAEGESPAELEAKRARNRAVDKQSIEESNAASVDAENKARGFDKTNAEIAKAEKQIAASKGRGELPNRGTVRRLAQLQESVKRVFPKSETTAVKVKKAAPPSRYVPMDEALQQVANRIRKGDKRLYREVTRGYANVESPAEVADLLEQDIGKRDHQQSRYAQSAHALADGTLPAPKGATKGAIAPMVKKGEIKASTEGAAVTTEGPKGGKAADVPGLHDSFDNVPMGERVVLSGGKVGTLVPGTTAGRGGKPSVRATVVFNDGTSMAVSRGDIKGVLARSDEGMRRLNLQNYYKGKKP